MSDTTAVAPPGPRAERMHSGALLAFGVVLPLVTLAVELTTRLNASVFFDPLPTPLHALLVAFVVAANARAWFVCRHRKVAHVRRAGLAVSFAIGVALFYSVLFAPLLPMATIGVLYFGLGLFPWAPLASLISAIRFRVHLGHFAGQQGITFRTWPGVVLGLAALIALDLPSTITRVGARMASGDAVESRSRGMRLLRMFGSEDALLRMCYVRTGASTDMISFLINVQRPIYPHTARELYYRMTGHAFNSVPAPVDLRPGGGGLFDAIGFDADQGAEGVGGRVPDLWLADSRFDGSVSADAALGYLEWTMVLRNQSGTQREARAQIALPPGSVVSRVTLWIDGEEREAAFAGRRQVREAYEAVVRRSRDPVLVTSAGPDRIAMQLFPVPPGSQMKVRIGMTVPLGLTNAREATLRLPHFHERNFDVRKDLRHGVWIESKSKLHSALVASGGNSSPGMFRADVEDSRLSGRDASIIAVRSDQGAAWSADMRSTEHVVRQVISYDDTISPPRRLVVVVDGSASMRGMADEIAKDLAAIPEDVDVRLIFAHDDSDLSAESRSLSGAMAAKQIASFDYGGGHDNTAALVRGLDLASEQPDSAMIWIHGPQPVLMVTEEALIQRLARGPAFNDWYALQVAPGPNVITEKLDGLVSIDTLRADDLERLISTWRSGERRVTVRRERIEAGAGAMPANERTSDHLVRLWANDEVKRLIHSGPAKRAAAIELAQRYQLVTPISGAVVLETQQQYDAAGLQPVPEGSVPTIPEPEEWALIVVALLVLAHAYRRRRAVITARAV